MQHYLRSALYVAESGINPNFHFDWGWRTHLRVKSMTSAPKKFKITGTMGHWL
jgi:hypothetical protein